jgi:hypothetical protein
MSKDASILTPSSDEQVAWILGYEEEDSKQEAPAIPKEEISKALKSIRFEYKVYGFKSAIFTLQTTLEKYISKPLTNGIVLFILQSLNKSATNADMLDGISALFVNRALNLSRPLEQNNEHIPFIIQSLDHISETATLQDILFKEPALLTGKTQEPISNNDRNTLGNCLVSIQNHWQGIHTIKPDFSATKLAFGQPENTPAIQNHLRKFVEKAEPTGMLIEQRALIERKTTEALKRCYQKDAETPVNIHQAKQAEMIAHWILDAANDNTKALNNLCNVINFSLTQNLLDQPRFHDLPQDTQKAKIETLKERQLELRNTLKLQENERLTELLLLKLMRGSFSPVLKTFLRALIPSITEKPLDALADFVCGGKAEGDISHPYIPGMIRESRILNARMKLHEKLGLLALPKDENSRK